MDKINPNVRTQIIGTRKVSDFIEDNKSGINITTVIA